MFKTFAILAAVTLGLSGCAGSSPDDNARTDLDEQTIGSLSLNLRGSDSSGREYRLRNAEFNVSGYPDYSIPSQDGGFAWFSTTVSTETAPDAPEISLKLVPGYYNISLNSTDYYLERYDGTSWSPVEQVVLLSGPYQSVYVYDGALVRVAFRFGVDGELIDFRSGDVGIGIEIEQPGEGAPGDGGFFGGTFGGTGGIGGGFGGAADAGAGAVP